MTSVEFVPATADLAREFYGKTPPFTFRGFIAVKDGQPVGVGGIFLYGDMPVAFSETRGMGRKDRARGFRLLEEQFDEHRSALYAVQDESEPGSGTTLPRLGFRPTGQRIEYGPLWVREA